jgi:hypothetical protein
MMRRPALPALAFALLLAAMSAGQLASFGAFQRAIDDYGVFGSVREVAAVVAATELAAAAGLLASAFAPQRVGRAAGLAGLAVAVFWGVVAAQAFARGLELDNCGCFGAYLAQPLRWWVLFEDAYMLVLGWYAAAAAGVPIPAPALRLRPTQEAT